MIYFYSNIQSEEDSIIVFGCLIFVAIVIAAFWFFAGKLAQILVEASDEDSVLFPSLDGHPLTLSLFIMRGVVYASARDEIQRQSSNLSDSSFWFMILTIACVGELLFHLFLLIQIKKRGSLDFLDNVKVKNWDDFKDHGLLLCFAIPFLLFLYSVITVICGTLLMDGGVAVVRLFFPV